METNHSETSSPTNPLILYRLNLDLTPDDMALETMLGVGLIKAQELGIPHHLHARFIRAYPDCVGLIPAYQDFRVAKRRNNFPPTLSAPTTPTDSPSFFLWLDQQGLTKTEFSEKACMPIPDINACLRSHRLPSTIVRFFEEIA